MYVADPPLHKRFGASPLVGDERMFICLELFPVLNNWISSSSSSLHLITSFLNLIAGFERTGKTFLKKFLFSTNEQDIVPLDVFNGNKTLLKACVI